MQLLKFRPNIAKNNKYKMPIVKFTISEREQNSDNVKQDQQNTYTI